MKSRPVRFPRPAGLTGLAERGGVVAAPAFAQIPFRPIYEESFNFAHERVQFRNGGKLGGPGTGVSGKIEDEAYFGVPVNSEQEKNGPAALAVSPIAPNSLSAFTCTFWYLLDEHGPEIQVPLSTAGVAFLLNEGGFEVRIENQLDQPRYYPFNPGQAGPVVPWRAKDRWIFAAFSWNQARNALTVHQGTPEVAVAYMRTMTRPTPARPSLPRTDLARFPETIGNTAKGLDRPLAGRMDNVRFFDRELIREELESIRKADLANAPIPLR